MPIIPQSATQENQEGRYVYMLDENKTAKLVYIKTMGQTDDGYWIVSDGVKVGDTIITSGLQKVMTGKPVRVVAQVADTTPKKVKKEGFVQKIIKKIVKKIKK